MSPSIEVPAASPGVAPRISVVIPTYRRAEAVTRLVTLLDAQTLPPADFEALVIDDGSPEDPRPRILSATRRFHLVVDRQPNSGPAVARHRGAELARAPVLLFLDDDMVPSPALLEEHLRVHDATPRAAVIGDIRPSERLATLSLFERFHAKKLRDFATELRTTGRHPYGTELCSGNLSVRRADYLATGGFDPRLGRSEDMELGLRLERAGVAIRFSEAAFTLHESDHEDLAGWLRGAFTYGVSDERISRKHPDAPLASPWHYLDIVSLVPQPAYALALAAPRVAHVATRALMGVAGALDKLGFERPALAGTMLAYGVEYYRGVRSEVGTAADCARELRAFRSRRAREGSLDVRAHRRHMRRGPATPSRRRAALDRFVASVRADHEMLLRSDAKYDTRGRKAASLAHDVVERIGFQMLCAWRLMHLVRDAGSPTAAKILARLIRLTYGADIHWNAQLADGVGLNHGMGLAVGHSARIGRGVILSHNVSIGDGRDPVTGKAGQPTLEENVHVGPGVTLLGPITIGARTKIGPGAVVLQSVPPDSIVEAPAPIIRPRPARAPHPSPELGDASGLTAAPPVAHALATPAPPPPPLVDAAAPPLPAPPEIVGTPTIPIVGTPTISPTAS